MKCDLECNCFEKNGLKPLTSIRNVCLPPVMPRHQIEASKADTCHGQTRFVSFLICVYVYWAFDFCPRHETQSRLKHKASPICVSLFRVKMSSALSRVI